MRGIGTYSPTLYPSRSKTHEATPEQQAERDRYWRDEEYMCPSFEREPTAILFDINTHTDWRTFRYSEEPLQEGSYDSWHRYEFEDGEIIYMRTDNKGMGYEPPRGANYQLSIVTLQKSWWEK